MTKSKIEAIFDLTPLQQGMLYHTVSVQNSTAYNIQMILTLEGRIDEKVLEQSWQKIIDRYTALRTSFAWENIKKPYQVVNREVNFEVEKLDLSDLNEGEQNRQFDEFIKTDLARPIELKKAPLMRLSLIRLASEKYRLVWIFNHISIEGWSAAILLGEFWQIYENLSSGKTSELGPVVPYVDYINWLKKQDQNKASQYWRENLKGFTSATQLPIDKALTNEVAQVTHIDKCSVEIPADKMLALNELVRKNKITLNTLIQGVWAILLSRYSGEEDIVFGATVSGRPAELANVERMVGMFVNVLPVRCKVRGNEQLMPWLQALQLNQAGMRQYEYSSLMQIKSSSEVKGGQPLFNTVLAFENWLGDFSSGEIVPGIRISNIEDHEMSDQPIMLMVNLGEKITLTLKYDTDRFDQCDIEALLEHYKILLENIQSDSTRQISELSILSAGERQQQLFDWNNTATDYALNTTLAELFETQVDKTPDRIALTFENDNLSYLELEQRANQLAHCLRAAKINVGDYVAVCMERSFELVISLYAIHKAGAAYLPLDPENAVARLNWMIEDIQAKVILSQSDLSDKLSDNGATVISLDGDNWETNISQFSQSRLPLSAHSDDPAYVIYTSGSTGKPKGVINAHSGVVNLLFWMQDTYSLTADDCDLQKTPYSFDVSVLELFWPLVNGSRLVIARPGGHKDPEYIATILREQHISTLHFVPSMLRVFLENVDIKDVSTLKRVICIGEAVTYELQQQFFQQSSADLLNLYGPTEAAVIVSHWTCRRDDESTVVPIGFPIANTKLYILDSYNQPVPVGVSGELHIGGVQVALGYLNRAELTAKQFIADPFDSDGNTRLYKTGDSARYLPDGSIECLGRMDNQIKLRGFRIELDEIEFILTEHPDIKTAVVIVREDVAGDQRLVAYIVSSTTVTNNNVAEIKDFLRLQLPEYMVPSAIVWLDELPFLSNGKIDRKSLPAPSRDINRDTGESTVVENPLEKTMIAIWEELLELDDVRANDIFFDLGGHSLLSLKVVEKFKKETGIRISPASIVSQTLRQVVGQAEINSRSGNSAQNKSRGPRFLNSIKNVLSRNS